MLNSGSFTDFLNSLRAFESGVSEERIETNRGEVIQQVGQDRFDAFEAGELTVTDLQYSSVNFLGFTGYQFGEGILIDTGYYGLDSTGFQVVDFIDPELFTGKNGVNSLDDLKTNVQEQIILDEFQLNLDRIENGLAETGQSLDDFIGESFTVTETDGSQTEVELSLTGILASAHLSGAFGTLDFLLDSVAADDQIGTSNSQFVQQFGGFDASLADLRAGTVEPLVTDATLTVDQPFEDRDGNVAVASQVRTFDPDTGSFEVTGTDGIDGSADGENGDDVIRTFDGDDSSVGFAGNDFQDLGAGNDRGFGLSGDDTLLGREGDDVLNGDDGDFVFSEVASGSDILVGGPGDDVLRGDSVNTNQAADRFVFSAGDGNDTVVDFQVDLDTLDFTAFDNDPAVPFNQDPPVGIEQQGANTVVSVGDVTVTLEGVDADTLNEDNFLGAEFDFESLDSGAPLADQSFRDDDDEGIASDQSVSSEISGDTPGADVLESLVQDDVTA